MLRNNQNQHFKQYVLVIFWLRAADFALHFQTTLLSRPTTNIRIQTLLFSVLGIKVMKYWEIYCLIQKRMMESKRDGCIICRMWNKKPRSDWSKTCTVYTSSIFHLSVPNYDNFPRAPMQGLCPEDNHHCRGGLPISPFSKQFLGILYQLQPFFQENNLPVFWINDSFAPENGTYCIPNMPCDWPPTNKKANDDWQLIKQSKPS